MANTPENPATDPSQEDAGRLLDAVLKHVPFEGWNDRSVAATIADTGIDAGLARVLFPRGALDMLVAFHRRLDERLAEAIATQPPEGRIRDRVAEAVLTRIMLAEPYREAAQRGASLLALPTHASEGARIVWNTADAIWNALDDPSRDYNWYTKRALLATTYATTSLYWLGDESEGYADTRAFLDRRIDGIMRIEGYKACLRKSPLAGVLLAFPRACLRQVRAPGARRGDGLAMETPG